MMDHFSRNRRCFNERVVHLAALALAIAASAPAVAGSWPERPVQMIVPFPPGSSPDILARIVAEPLAKILKQPVIVENKPGAGGNIGTRYASKAKPDGYTIVLTINGPMVTAPALYKRTLGYKPQTDLTPISLIGTSPNVLIVPANFGAKTVKEFVDIARSRPGELNYGTVGPGSSSHLSMAMLEHMAGISLQQIPYSGFPQVLTSIINGDIQCAFMVPGIAMPQITAGKVRALAVTSLEPTDLLPGIPTMAAQGYAGFESISWDALFAPRNTPAPVLHRLNAELNRILRLPEVRQKLAALYFSASPSTSQELGDRVRSETLRWNEVIERLKLVLD